MEILPCFNSVWRLRAKFSVLPSAVKPAGSQNPTGACTPSSFSKALKATCKKSSYQDSALPSCRLISMKPKGSCFVEHVVGAWKSQPPGRDVANYTHLDFTSTQQIDPYLNPKIHLAGLNSYLEAELKGTFQHATTEFSIICPPMPHLHQTAILISVHTNIWVLIASATLLETAWKST